MDTLDIQRIRQDFPQLRRSIKGKPPIYLDSACTSLRPEPVIQAIADYQRRAPVCHGRAYHRFGRDATEAYAAARHAAAQFVGAAADDEIVFVRNTTEGLNLVASCLELGPGDVVLTTDMEHNSNLLPWQRLARQGITHERLTVDPALPGGIDLHALRARLAWHAGKLKLVSMFQVSNLTGVELPTAQICREAHDHGALVLVDGAQSVTTRAVDVQQLGADFFAFSLHKMFGPSGIGVLWGRRAALARLRPFILGGETIEDVTYEEPTMAPVPARFEAGVSNVEGAVGARAAIQYLQGIGVQRMARHVHQLNRQATEGLQHFSRVQLLGPADPAQRGSILNFHVRGLDSKALAGLLDRQQNIMVRYGKQCVHAWYNSHQIPESVRVSFGIYNTPEEIETLLVTLRSVLSMLG